MPRGDEEKRGKRDDEERRVKKRIAKLNDHAEKARKVCGLTTRPIICWKVRQLNDEGCDAS